MYNQYKYNECFFDFYLYNIEHVINSLTYLQYILVNCELQTLDHVPPNKATCTTEQVNSTRPLIYYNSTENRTL